MICPIIYVAGGGGAMIQASFYLVGGACIGGQHIIIQLMLGVGGQCKGARERPLI